MNKISRRVLFGAFFENKNANRNAINSSLDEYTQPLTRLQVAHILRRTTSGISTDLLNKYTGKTANELVETLFQNADNKINPTPPFFINETFKNPANLSGNEKTDTQNRLNKLGGDYNIELGTWWYKLLKSDSESVLEKLVLFWHGHLTTRYGGCSSISAIAMYRQNDLFRKNYAGNFNNILQKITLDSAMLRFLNGNENVSRAPNENYARELMELFTIGVGNYTEQDIKEAAKILTGWYTTIYIDEGTPYEATININNFDQNSKLFMGEVFNVNYELTYDNIFNFSVKKLLDTIITKKSKECAQFMAKKLYKFFVYANPQKIDEKVINEMADVFIANNFEFKPVLKKLFKSQHFFDDLNIGIQIKSPAETIIGFTKHFDFKEVYIRNVMAILGLELFNPPNVAGWKDYRNWISTKTLPLTIDYLIQILAATSDEKLSQWIKGFPNYDNPTLLATQIIELFIVRPVANDRLKKYTNSLLANAPDYEWYSILNDPATCGQRVRALIHEIIKAPDYYLY